MCTSSINSIYSGKAVPYICITTILFCGFFNVTGSFLLSDSSTYDFHSIQANGVGSQPEYYVVQYSDSFMPLDNLLENGNGSDISNENNHRGNNNPVKMPPSTPSLFTSKLTVSGSDSGIKSETGGKNNGIDSSDTDKKGQKIDNICGYKTTKKIGYVITGSGKISGTDKDNYLIGSETTDIICAKKGNDIVMALGGNDLVYSGGGDDTVYGGDGNNQLFGEDGKDNVIGGQFDDLLSGGNDNDHLAGVAGDDTMLGGAGANFFDCGDGMDTIIDYNPSKGDVISNNCEIVNNIDQRQ